MSRKSTIVTLGILGAVAAAGLCVCCSGSLTGDDPGAGGGDGLAADNGAADDGAGKGGGGGRGSGRSIRWFPIFLGWGGGGGGVSRPAGPAHTGGGTSSGTSHGGFGATGSSHGGGAVGA